MSSSRWPGSPDRGPGRPVAPGDAIRRGLAGGLVGGLLAGVFALLVGQGPMDEAVRLEEQGHAQLDDDEDPLPDGAVSPPEGSEAAGRDDEHLFSRATQVAMLPVGTALVGLAFGGLFGAAFALLRPGSRTGSHWTASLLLGGTAWAVAALAPLLTHPPDPPGAGPASGVGSRTGGYLLTVAVAVAIALVARATANRLSETSLTTAGRQVLVGTAIVALATIAVVLLPGAPATEGVPPELLWRFRLTSLGTQTVLWVGIAVTSGLLWERAAHRDPNPATVAG